MVKSSFIPPCVDNEVIYFLKTMLSQSPKAEEMNKFFYTFGTHQVTKLALGSRYTASTTITER